jgi:hypothetical protein
MGVDCTIAVFTSKGKPLLYRHLDRAWVFDGIQRISPEPIPANELIEKIKALPSPPQHRADYANHWRNQAIEFLTGRGDISAAIVNDMGTSVGDIVRSGEELPADATLN